MIILTSTDFYGVESKKAITNALNKSIDKIKVLFFPNEYYTHQGVEKGLYKTLLTLYGFSSENIHIFDYDKPTGFDNLDIDCLYVGGGNTFLTYQLIKKSGADNLIKNYISKGVAYVGGSAGAHIATKNIEHVKFFDDMPDGYSDFEGLGLYNGIIFCHYDYTRKPYVDNAIKEGKYHVKILTDNDYLIIE